MGMAESFGQAFAKAQLAAGQRLPRAGSVFISVSERDKRNVIPLARQFQELGFAILATRGTAAALRAESIPAVSVFKVNEGRPNIVDQIKTGRVHLVINTPLGLESHFDEKAIRRAAVRYNIPCITTMSAAFAAAHGIRALQEETHPVAALQALHAASAVGRTGGRGKESRSVEGAATPAETT